MHHPTCLNCETKLIDNYCHHCGQKAATHRITVKHFIMHDILHGIWHFDKGIFYTLRESFLRPGYMAMNYIKGKRILYYNFFYLLLLIIGLNVLTSHLFESWYGIKEAAPQTTTDNSSLDLTDFINNNFRMLLFLLIPFFALNGLMIFRKMKTNLAEHSIIAGTIILTGALWFFILTLHFYLTYYYSNWRLFDITSMILFFVMMLIPVQVYWQASRKRYTFMGFVWRMICWYLLLLADLTLILLIVYLVTGKSTFTLN